MGRDLLFFDFILAVFVRIWCVTLHSYRIEVTMLLFVKFLKIKYLSFLKN